MTETPASKALTDSLLSVIRQQRHYGARVIISTQEPSISPRLIDLCSITVIHRFSSPEWFSVLRKHISVVNDQERGNDGLVQLFKRILTLRTGEALIFAPSAIVARKQGDMLQDDGLTSNRHQRVGTTAVEDGLFKIRVRKRITWDGGQSIVCV